MNFPCKNLAFLHTWGHSKYNSACCRLPIPTAGTVRTSGCEMVLGAFMHGDSQVNVRLTIESLGAFFEGDEIYSHEGISVERCVRPKKREMTWICELLKLSRCNKSHRDFPQNGVFHPKSNRRSTFAVVYHGR